MAFEFDITQLSSPRSAEQLGGALRWLKNDVVGHIQKKEHWVQAGVLRPIVSIIEASSVRVNGKDSRLQYPPLRLSDDEAAKLEALQLLASFANAGPAFLPPLHAAGALSAVLSISCLQNDRSQIVLAALRVLRGITEAAAFAPAPCPLHPTSLADAIFSNNDHLDSFAMILMHPDSNREISDQVTIVARLISSLCREERHQYALVNHGILDALATRLASFAVAQGQVIPRAEIISRSEGLSDFIPAPAKPGIKLTDVLGAISAIVTDSRFRACRLLYSPSILAVLPNIDSEWGIFSRAPSESLELAGLKPTRQREIEPMDLLLPYMPAQVRGQPAHTATFPPLGSVSSRDSSSLNSRVTSKFNSRGPAWASNDDSFTINSETEEEEAESPLIPWLINLVRSRDGNEALMAASVLTSLFKHGFAYKTRETTLGLLVVPKLLQSLSTAEGMGQSESTSVDSGTASIWDTIERAPAILALLITDSETLQKAAFDSNAVKTMCKLLKGTYDTPPPATQVQPWSPHEQEEKMSLNNSPECQLGDPGQHRLLAHRIKVREGTLKALGALATFKEEYRKAMIEQDVMPYIVESLSFAPGRPKQPNEKTNGEAKIEGHGESSISEFGTNPTSVITAACYAVRMLSRSVNILRTSLIDNVVATPMFSLLRHPNLDVQNAATAAICNLVTDFSPMRDALIDAGVVKVLCDHTRSHSASLRLNALWALKHLVHAASMDLKKACLEELQSGWLVQLICDDTEDEALFSARNRGDKVNSSTLDDMDEDMDVDDTRCFYRPCSARAAPDCRILQLADTRLLALRENESNDVRKARQDDLAIQEQGLGFIRNLIGGAHSGSSADSTNDTTEMIDHLFNTLGQDRFFEILATKLRVKVLHPFSGRRGATGSETRVLYPQAKIIEAVVYILVHMAASIPRHRQLVIAQTDLLKLLANLFNNQDREVRVALCHLINNLTWQDDTNDAPACSQRAIELKRLGFLNKLECLRETDDELDVRERAKTALWQMKSPY